MGLVQLSATLSAGSSLSAELEAQPANLSTVATVAVGARLTDLRLDEGQRAVVLTYELIDESGTSLGAAGEVRVRYDALQTIDTRLGGTSALGPEQRLDLAAKLVPQVWGGRLVRTAPEPRPEPRHATVNASGSVAGVHTRGS